MQCISVAQLVKDQTVCGLTMTGKQRFRPAFVGDPQAHPCWGINRSRLSLNLILRGLTDRRTGLCMTVGIGTDHCHRQAVRKIMNDAVHQSQQRHHEQSQG